MKCFGDSCGYEGRERCKNTRCLHRPLLLKSRLGKILWVNVSLTKPGYNNHLLFLKVSRILTKPHRTYLSALISTISTRFEKKITSHNDSMKKILHLELFVIDCLGLGFMEYKHTSIYCL